MIKSMSCIGHALRDVILISCTLLSPLPSGIEIVMHQDLQVSLPITTGAPATPTWTSLRVTAQAGERHITLLHPVTWDTGDSIVIAASGDHDSQGSSEVKVITNKSSNNVTLTLDTPLEYKHLGDSIDFGNSSLLSVAKVAVLTRTIQIRGSDYWWHEVKNSSNGNYTG